MKNSLLNDCYVAIYDLDDNYIIGFDDIKALTQFFNVSLKRILFSIRNNYCMIKDSKKYKIYLYEKEKENEIIRRR